MSAWAKFFGAGSAICFAVGLLLSVGPHSLEPEMRFASYISAIVGSFIGGGIFMLWALIRHDRKTT